MFHKNKPIGLDGLMGSVIPLVQGVLGIPLRMTPQNSIHGFSCDILYLGFVLDWIWVPVYLGCLLVVAKVFAEKKMADAGGLVALLLAFLILQKNNTPQYSWWAVSLLPMIFPSWLSQSRKRLLFAVAITALLLGQIVYPLNYQSLMDSFYQDRPLAAPVFWINLLKNMLWVLALGIAVVPALPQRVSGRLNRLSSCSKIAG